MTEIIDHIWPGGGDRDLHWELVLVRLELEIGIILP